MHVARHLTRTVNTLSASVHLRNISVAISGPRSSSLHAGLGLPIGFDIARSYIRGVGMDVNERRKLEEERLARLAAKKRTASAEPEARPAKVQKLAPAVPLRQDVQSASSSTSTKPAIHHSSRASSHNELHVSRPQSTSQSKLEFPNGIVKKTWAFKHDRDGGDIKIEEVLQKRDLTTAIISSFCWDFDWLITKFDMTTIKFIFILQARNEKDKEEVESGFAGLSNVRLVFPKMSGSPYACMHSKLMLLFHPTYLRIVVPTANFIGFDWGETGEMEDFVWIADLPRLLTGETGQNNKTLNAFSTELMRYVSEMGLSDDAKAGILGFDFSKIADVRFVHTMAGTFTGDSASTTGFPQLSDCIRQLGLQTPFTEPLEVDMCASSIGALDSAQLEQFHRCLRGQMAVDTAPTPISKASPTKKGEATQTKLAFTKPKEEEKPKIEETSLTKDSKFRIVFPSVDTIKASTAGSLRAGTLFFNPEYYGRDSFPSDCVHEYISRRTGMLSHSKLIFARSPSNAFAYVGSHNLSQSAWGRRTYDKKEKKWKLTCANWECGVLVPVRQINTPGSTSIVEEDGRTAEDEVGADGELDEADISTASEDSETESEPDSKSVRKPRKKLTKQKVVKSVLPIEVFKGVVDVPFIWPPKRYGPTTVPWCARSGPIEGRSYLSCLSLTLGDLGSKRIGRRAVAESWRMKINSTSLHRLQA